MEQRYAHYMWAVSEVSQKVNFVEHRDGLGFAFASSWVQLGPD